MICVLVMTLHSFKTIALGGRMRARARALLTFCREAAGVCHLIDFMRSQDFTLSFYICVFQWHVCAVQVRDCPFGNLYLQAWVILE